MTDKKHDNKQNANSKNVSLKDKHDKITTHIGRKYAPIWYEKLKRRNVQ